mmetsp:Transcript_10310/g.15869  ORF Transcript_10310/g.15869 Transcript_10310/m.15869 type:complete len:82 (-) Transcript_10310:346-591(-)
MFQEPDYNDCLPTTNHFLSLPDKKQLSITFKIRGTCQSYIQSTQPIPNFNHCSDEGLPATDVVAIALASGKVVCSHKDING